MNVRNVLSVTKPINATFVENVNVQDPIVKLEQTWRSGQTGRIVFNETKK